MPSTTMTKPRTQSKPQTKKQAIKHQSHQKPDQKHNIQQQQQHSWAVVRGLLQTCKHSNSHTQQNQQEERLKKQKQKQKQAVVVVVGADNNKKSNKKMKCSGSLCSNTKVMHRPDQSQNQTPSPHQLHKKRSHSSSTSSSSSLSSTNNEASSTSSSSSRSIKLTPQNNNNNDLAIVTSSLSSSSSSLSVSSSSSNSFRGMPFRRFSTCYECRMVVDPVLGLVKSDPSLRPTICSCPHCGQVFMKPESLELHQALRHAVSELGPEDTSKNIVEIIFQSSWAHHLTNNNNNNNNNKQHIPCPRIDRVLKIHNTQTTIANFESYREAVKSKARPAAATRCAADGNELLRFRAAAFACTLGLNGSTVLCGAAACGACAVIRSGFGPAGPGIMTTATSGRAHAAAADADVDAERRRAMVVCRVIAGRVKKSSSSLSSSLSSSCDNVGLEEYDSVAAEAGLYSNLDELYVFNPKAILPCFLVIYSAF